MLDRSTLTLDLAIESRRSVVCPACGQRKRRESVLCYDCYRRTPPWLKEDLQYIGSKSHLDALHSTLLELKAEQFHTQLIEV